MSKPNGLSATLQVLKPSRAEDAIWDAVQEAIDAGMTPERFKREVMQAWMHELSEETKRVEKLLSR